MKPTQHSQPSHGKARKAVKTAAKSSPAPKSIMARMKQLAAEQEALVKAAEQEALVEMKSKMQDESEEADEHAADSTANPEEKGVKPERKLEAKAEQFAGWGALSDQELESDDEDDDAGDQAKEDEEEEEPEDDPAPMQRATRALPKSVRIKAGAVCRCELCLRTSKELAHELTLVPMTESASCA